MRATNASLCPNAPSLKGVIALTQNTNGFAVTGAVPVPTIAGAIGIAVIAAIACASAVYVATGSQYAAQTTALIEQENAAVCTQLGFVKGNANYRECAAALDQVRANEARRRDESIL